jgi:hypothetical protein
VDSKGAATHAHTHHQERDFFPFLIKKKTNVFSGVSCPGSRSGFDPVEYERQVSSFRWISSASNAIPRVQFRS